MGGGLISEIKRFEKYRVHFCTFQILKKMPFISILLVLAEYQNETFYFDFASLIRISKCYVLSYFC